MKREHYRPFNPEQAQAGAPYGHKDNAIEVKIYEYFDTYCTAAHRERDDVWIGTSYDFSHDYLVMLPEATCQGKPVYRGDTLYDANGCAFQFSPEHTQSMLDECTWEPVKKWPETTLNSEDFVKAARHTQSSNEEWRAVANAAIAHACETRQVVPLHKVREIASFCYDNGKPIGGFRLGFDLVWKNANSEFLGDQ